MPSDSFGFADPTLQKGDLFTRNATQPKRLAVGANGSILQADSSTDTGLAWSAAGTVQVKHSSNGLVHITGTGAEQAAFTKSFVASDWVQGDTMRIISRISTRRTAGAGDITITQKVGTAEVFNSGNTNDCDARVYVEEREISADGTRGLRFSEYAVNGATGNAASIVGVDPATGNAGAHFGAAFDLTINISPAAGTNYDVYYSVTVERIPTGI